MKSAQIASHNIDISDNRWFLWEFLRPDRAVKDAQERAQGGASRIGKWHIEAYL